MMPRGFRRLGLLPRNGRRPRSAVFVLATPVPLYSRKVRAVFGHLLETEPSALGPEQPCLGEAPRDAAP